MRGSSSITIAVPTYNRGERLRTLLDSIQAQALETDELLVFDDSSNDSTASLNKDYPKIHFTRNVQNVGMVPNWNLCLKAATKNWICIIHDDDELLPGGLAILRSFCDRVAEPTLIAHRQLEAPHDHAMRYRYCEPGAWAAWNCPTLPSGVVLHRQIIEEIGHFDESFPYSADIEYFGRVCARFPHYVIENPGVVNYRLHDSNHQFATWRKSDFFDNYEAMQRRLLMHTGILGGEAKDLLEKRLKGDLLYMLFQARRLADRALIRSICRRLLTYGGWGWRWKSNFLMGASTGILMFGN